MTSFSTKWTFITITKLLTRSEKIDTLSTNEIFLFIQHHSTSLWHLTMLAFFTWAKADYKPQLNTDIREQGDSKMLRYLVLYDLTLQSHWYEYSWKCCLSPLGRTPLFWKKERQSFWEKKTQEHELSIMENGVLRTKRPFISSHVRIKDFMNLTWVLQNSRATGVLHKFCMFRS